MPYRHPAEDEEAARDASELAAFTLTVRRARFRGLVIAAAVGVAGVALLLVSMRFLLTSARRPTSHDPSCHEILIMSGSPLVSRREMVCPPERSSE